MYPMFFVFLRPVMLVSSNRLQLFIYIKLALSKRINIKYVMLPKYKIHYMPITSYTIHKIYNKTNTIYCKNTEITIFQVSELFTECTDTDKKKLYITGQICRVHTCSRSTFSCANLAFCCWINESSSLDIFKHHSINKQYCFTRTWVHSIFSFAQVMWHCIFLVSENVWNGLCDKRADGAMTP